MRSLFSRRQLSRDEIVVCSKGGYLPFDTEEFHDRFVSTGLCQPSDLVGGEHCLAPAFLDDQIRRSRQHLGVETIDVYFLHNPEEQLVVMGSEAFTERVLAAFGELERAVEAGHIVCYGIAIAQAFRTKMRFPQLDQLLDWAHQVGGAEHHFRAIQVPINLWIRDAVFDETHLVDGRSVSLVEAAQALNIAVLSSVSINGGRLSAVPSILRGLCPEALSDVQVALQFSRSVAGVTTALVGMSRTEHVEENLSLRRVSPLNLGAPYSDAKGVTS